MSQSNAVQLLAQGLRTGSMRAAADLDMFPELDRLEEGGSLRVTVIRHEAGDLIGVQV